MAKKLSHINKDGKACMVDVSKKKISRRIAIAHGKIYLKPETLKLIMSERVQKGDVFTVAKAAGIMAAKKAYEIIPMCHPLLIEDVKVG